MVFIGFSGGRGRRHLDGLVAGGFVGFFLEVEKKKGGLIGWGFLMESNCMLRERESSVFITSVLMKRNV